MCLVAFQKIFRKIFSGVWKRRRKTQIQKNTSHNPEKNHQQRQIQSDDRAIDRDPRSRSTTRSRSLAFFARLRSTARSREGEIAIDDAISRSVDRDLGSSSLAYIRDLAISDLPFSSSIAISIRRDLAKARSRSTAQSCDGEIAFDASPLARVRSLPLSLIFWKCFEGKIEV